MDISRIYYTIDPIRHLADMGRALLMFVLLAVSVPLVVLAVVLVVLTMFGLLAAGGIVVGVMIDRSWFWWQW